MRKTMNIWIDIKDGIREKTKNQKVNVKIERRDRPHKQTETKRLELKRMKMKRFNEHDGIKSRAEIHLI